MSDMSFVPEEKRKALELALNAIEKNYGKGALLRLRDKPNTRLDAIPTGALTLDVA